MAIKRPSIPVPTFDKDPDAVVEPVGDPIDMAKHHSSRTKDRKQALDILFEADLLGNQPVQVLAEASSAERLAVRPFARQIVTGVGATVNKLDRLIAQFLSTGWTVQRMPRVDRCLARIAVWEITEHDTPAAVAISEAVSLAEELSTVESSAFLNGLLTAISSSQQDQPI